MFSRNGKSHTVQVSLGGRFEENVNWGNIDDYKIRDSWKRGLANIFSGMKYVVIVRKPN